MIRATVIAALCCIALNANAQDAKPNVEKRYVGRTMTGERVPFPEGVKRAVNGFEAALEQGDLKSLEEFLAPDLIVYEEGHAEMSRDQYLKEHAPADAQALKRRTIIGQPDARTSIHNGWALRTVKSVSEMAPRKSGDPVRRYSNTETLVLRERGGIWQIQHIHWSSSELKPADASNAQ